MTPTSEVHQSARWLPPWKQSSIQTHLGPTWDMFVPVDAERAVAFKHGSGDPAIVVSLHLDGEIEWIHASIARGGVMPTHDDLKLLHAAVFPNGFAYQVVPSGKGLIPLHPRALHLWGRLDGIHVLPNFARY